MTAGQVNETTVLVGMLDQIYIKNLGGGRPRVRPLYLCADSGYSSKKNRKACKVRGVESVIKPKGNELDQDVYDALKYKEGAKVEHSNTWLKECRRLR